MSLQWYKTGTVSVTNGSKTVIGTGTNFVAVAQLAPGDTLTIDNSTLYEIATVDSDTQLTLVDNYAGTTLAGQNYGVIRLTGTSLSNAELAGKVSALLNKWINRENEIIAWQAGTATGGPASDGRYPLTDPTGAVTNVECPAKVSARVDALGSAAGANILGTVSQSAGVPTGAIIESGSNVNGGYIKFANGTLICTLAGVVTNTLLANFSTEESYPFPAVFIDLAKVSCSGGYMAGLAWDTNLQFSAFTASFLNQNWSVRINPGSTAQTGTISLIAIGRWF